MKNDSAKCDDRAACILYTDSDVANILLLPKKMIHKLVREKKLACVQITPRIRRFTPEQVQQYIDSHSTPPPVDKKDSRPVSSPPRKGGDAKESRLEKAKDSWASLKKEMSRWT
ncbi:MAG: helix-turn-helix domain-containing protein [Desulfomonile tiedjei]|uniref:Helix-turn-helix domain-containing protein n=1 Tax=Desulfomonile tiedjei TaxID=2358 RepID=A0A9D6V331_9BACT|nr:helix-turn-helix domain-containing protein [Desulfomonile tiedjei]